MNRVRGIPTSRAFWELKAEQVLNRVFKPEAPIVVEVCDTPSLASGASRVPTREHDLSTTNHSEGWHNQLGSQSRLVLAGVSVTVIVMVGMALVALGIWNQSQQAIRQERNMLLIERLRSLRPSSLSTGNNTAQTVPPETTAPETNLPPPPPSSSEPWMEELATLPTSGGPMANPAPAASATASGGGGDTVGSVQLVGVVQVPGQSGSAIFQLGGNSTSATVGEGIGNSGWRLHSANGDSAVIEKGGEQRRVSISGGF